VRSEFKTRTHRHRSASADRPPRRETTLTVDMGGLELPNRYNVGADLLDRNLMAGREGKVAIHSAGGDVTYRELFRLACGAARTLAELGVRREERVLIVAFDSPGWVAAFLGAIRHGAVPVPVNPLLQRSEDYDHFIEDSLARVVVVDAASEDKVKAAIDRASEPPHLLRAGQISAGDEVCLLYTSPSPRDLSTSRMPSSA